MHDIFSTKNLAMAGGAVAATMITLNLTSEQSKLVQGLASFGVALVVMHFAAKHIGGGKA